MNGTDKRWMGSIKWYWQCIIYPIFCGHKLTVLTIWLTCHLSSNQMFRILFKCEFMTNFHVLRKFPHMDLDLSSTFIMLKINMHLMLLLNVEMKERTV